MKTSASKAKLMEQLNGYLHDWPVTDVAFALAEPPDQTMHGTRLILNVSGERDLCSSPGKSNYRVLQETPLLVGPSRQLVSAAGGQFSGMTITYGRNATHFLGLESPLGVRNGACAFYCSTSALDDAGMQQMAVLFKLGESQAHSPKAVSPMLQALLFLTRDCLSQGPITGGKAEGTWQAIKEFLYEHCSGQVSREVVAHVFDICPSYVSRLVAEQTGQSFSEYLTRLRMERAARLLQNPDLSVQRTARLCGFNHAAYFIRVFREHFGSTPRKFRSLPV